MLHFVVCYLQFLSDYLQTYPSSQVELTDENWTLLFREVVNRYVLCVHLWNQYFQSVEPKHMHSIAYTEIVAATNRLGGKHLLQCH